MTAPRQVLKGSCYHVTRRCAQRTYLLRPSKTVNDVFRFLLAVAAQRYGIRIHVFTVMSNHYHFLLTDPDARLPQFEQYLDALVARAVNASYGQWEHFWASGSFSATRLEAPADVVSAAAYILANPVSAGLVRSARLWPGLWSDPDHFGGSVRAERPSHFFSKRGRAPAALDLELSIPAGFASADDFRDQVVAAWRALEEDARRRVGKGFVGVAGVLAQDPFGRPKSVEPRRNMRPRIASRSTTLRVEALARLAQFAADYRAAFARRRAGDVTAVFPAGTYLMRVLHNAPCSGFG